MTGALDYRHGRVQRLRRLLARPATRRAEEAFVVEGAKLVAEALAANLGVEGLYVAPGASDPVIDRAVGSGVRVFDLAPGVLERVADTVTPQPVMAVVAMPRWSLEDVRGGQTILVCVDVRDPGNLGTVLRTAEASGVAGVVCCDGSVDPYNPKCVRASAGSVFHVRLVAGGDPVQVLEALGGWGVRRLGTQATGGTPYDAVDFGVATAVVLGNEAHGLPPALGSLIDGDITVPMIGRSESLNVGMAAAVICFEAARQRSAGRGPR